MDVEYRNLTDGRVRSTSFRMFVPLILLWGIPVGVGGAVVVFDGKGAASVMRGLANRIAPVDDPRFESDGIAHDAGSKLAACMLEKEKLATDIGRLRANECDGRIAVALSDGERGVLMAKLNACEKERGTAQRDRDNAIETSVSCERDLAEVRREAESRTLQLSAETVATQTLRDKVRDLQAAINRMVAQLSDATRKLEVCLDTKEMCHKARLAALNPGG